MPDDGVVLARRDLDRIFVDLRALIDGTAPLDANRAHAVNIAVTITQALERNTGGERWPSPRQSGGLESQTGESVPYTPEEPAEGRERHLSVRVDHEMAAALESIATERGSTLSQLVRELLREAVGMRQNAASLDAHALVDRLAAEVAEVRRRLAG